MKALYNFTDAESGLFIGNLHELELAVCPRVGEMVGFAADGQEGERLYTVEMVTHHFPSAFMGEGVSHIIDISVRAVTTSG